MHHFLFIQLMSGKLHLKNKQTVFLLSIPMCHCRCQAELSESGLGWKAGIKVKQLLSTSIHGSAL